MGIREVREGFLEEVIFKPTTERLNRGDPGRIE